MLPGEDEVNNVHQHRTENKSMTLPSPSYQIENPSKMERKYTAHENTNSTGTNARISGVNTQCFGTTRSLTSPCRPSTTATATTASSHRSMATAAYAIKARLGSLHNLHVHGSAVQRPVVELRHGALSILALFEDYYGAPV